MNPQTVRNQTQLYKIREAYLANLELEQKNLQKTGDAVSALNQTGQVPLAPQDTRSISEKITDVEKLKISLRRNLLDITDSQQAANIMNALSNDEVQALAIVSGDVFSVLKAKYTNGVPAPIFLEYFRRYLKNYNTNMGLASGNQGVIAEELKLTRDMIQRVMPSPPIMDELMRAIATAPPGKARDDAIDAAQNLARAFPNIDDIAATQNILSEVELANLSTLITDALEATPSAAQVQKLTKDIINALRSGSNREVESVLTKALNVVKIEQAELAQLNSISEALRQEQAESLRPPSIITPSPDSARIIDEIAILMNQKPKTVRTSQGDITSMVTKKGPITARDRRVAEDIMLLERLSADDLVAPMEYGKSVFDKINKPGLVKFWDYISKRDRGIPLDKAELATLSALNKDELKRIVLDFKKVGGSPFEEGKPELRKEKTEAKESTASQTGGISAGARLEARLEPKLKFNAEQAAIYDLAQGKLMDINKFLNLEGESRLEYLGYLLQMGVFDMDVTLKEDIADLVARDAATLKESTLEGVYDRVKRVTGMGMKKKGKSKNIVFGCGLTKSVTRPKKEFSEKIDFSEGLPKDKSYIPFGKYVIHKHKLTGGILQVRTIKGGAIPKLPTLGISPSLGKIIKKMVGGGLPTYDEMSALNEDEKNTLYKVFKLSNIDKADMLPSPDKTKEEQEMNRFQILKGQIQAGNDSADLIKEFKCMLMRFISGGKIPRGQGMEIVCDLMALGY
jgi:hypothetical protein